MASAEDLYSRAYGLQYDEQDATAAASLYIHILREFPDSEQAGFAREQLAKLGMSQEQVKSAAKDFAAHPKPIMVEDWRRIKLTTAPSLEGFRVVETLDVVTAECAYGMNLFRDFFASLTDTFGGRSQATQNVLRDARTTCLFQLRREAHATGANAVIAVNLAYSEFSGGGKSMLFLVASGTAVRVEKIKTAPGAAEPE